MAYNQNKGVWRTIGGRRVFIAEGMDLAGALEASGKFGKGDGKQLWLPAKEYGHVIHELNSCYESFKDKKHVEKCIGDYVYFFDNHGFDKYTIIRRWKITGADKKTRGE